MMNALHEQVRRALKGNSTQKTNKLQMKGLIMNSSDTKFDDSTHLR